MSYNKKWPDPGFSTLRKGSGSWIVASGGVACVNNCQIGSAGPYLITVIKQHNFQTGDVVFVDGVKRRIVVRDSRSFEYGPDAMPRTLTKTLKAPTPVDLDLVSSILSAPSQTEPMQRNDIVESVLKSETP